MRVSPFRYLRIAGYLLLPGTFRSLSRLSSAPSAKASSLCSFLHDLFPHRLFLLPEIGGAFPSLIPPSVAAGPVFGVVSRLLLCSLLGCLSYLSIFKNWFQCGVFKVLSRFRHASASLLRRL